MLETWMLGMFPTLLGVQPETPSDLRGRSLKLDHCLKPLRKNPALGGPGVAPTRIRSAGNVTIAEMASTLLMTHFGISYGPSSTVSLVAQSGLRPRPIPHSTEPSRDATYYRRHD